MGEGGREEGRRRGRVGKREDVYVCAYKYLKLNSFTFILRTQMARWAGGVNFLMDELGAATVLSLEEAEGLEKAVKVRERRGEEEGGDKRKKATLNAAEKTESNRITLIVRW